MKRLPPCAWMERFTRVLVITMLTVAIFVLAAALALPATADTAEPTTTPTPTVLPVALNPVDPLTQPALAALLQTLPARTPQLEARRRATYLHGEGDRLLQAGQVTEAHKKWLAAIKEYEKAESGVQVLQVSTLLAESYIREAYRTFNPAQARVGLDFALKGIRAGAEIYDDLMRPYQSYDQTLLDQAQALYTRGAALCQAKQYRQGIDQLLEAEQIYHQAAYVAGEILAITEKAVCQVDNGNVFRALLSMVDALLLTSQLPAGDETTDLLWHGREQYERGDLTGAQITFQTVLARRQQEKRLSGVAGAYLALGDVQEALGNYPAAEKFYQQALPLYIELEDEYDDFNEALTRYNLANIAVFTGRYAEAVISYTQAIQIWQQIGKPFEEVVGLNALAMAFQNQGKYQDALATVERATALYQRLSPNPKFEAYLLHNTGVIHFSLSHYQEARQHLDRALSLLRNEPFQQYQEMQVQNNIAAIAATLGQFDEALVLYQQVVDFAQQQQRPTLVALAQFNIASIYIQQDKLQAGIAIFLEVLPFFQQQQMRPDEARTLQNIGVAYLKMGNLREAEAYLQQALAHAEAMQTTEYGATIQNNLGTIAFLTRQLTTATNYFEAALAAWRTQNNLIGMSRALGNLSLVAAADNDFQTAKRRSEEALVYTQQAKARVEQVRVLFALGFIDLALDLDEQADAHAQAALTLADQLDDPLAAVGGHIILGLSRIKQEDLTGANEQVQSAIALLESFQGSLTVPELKSAFFDQAAHLYAMAAFLAFQMEDPAQAFYCAEQGRARSFLDQLGNQRPDPGKNSTPLAQQEAALRQRIAQLQTALHDAQNQSLDEAAITPLATALESARTDYTRLLTQLKLAEPAYATLVSVTSLTLEEVQTQVLDDQTTLISYYTFDDLLSDKTFAWVIDRQQAQLVSLDITQTELKRSVQFLSNSIVAKTFSPEQAAQLYQSIFAPLQPYIHHTNLIIIPHQTLHYLPFAALWNDKTERYLLEEYTITYAPSASALQFMGMHYNANLSHALVLGNPDGSLPNAELEAAAVAQSFGTEPLLGQQATESQLWQQADAVDVLHLAAHGVYNPFNPFFSRLELARDDLTDGYWEVHEILALNLAGAPLVVLSACETAVGEQNRGDEIVSMTRSFLYAGASSVVSSLWQIDDHASAELMTAFYRSLRTGMTTAEALRAAQLVIAKKEQWQSPYYWAAFSLHGIDGTEAKSTRILPLSIP